MHEQRLAWRERVLYGKYLRRGDPFIALRVLVHHVRACKRWMRGALGGDEELAENGWAYLTETWPGIVAGWRPRSVHDASIAKASKMLTTIRMPSVNIWRLVEVGISRPSVRASWIHG